MKKLGLFLSIVLTTCGLWAASLDGTAWKVKVTPDAAAKAAGMSGFKNRFEFNNGMVHMTECAKSGYKDSAYESSEAGGLTTWSTEQMSDRKKDGGKTHWEGAIKGNDIEGTDIWTDPSGKSYKFTFKGQKITK